MDKTFINIFPSKLYNFLQTGACIVNDFKQVLAIGGSSTENPDILGFSHFRLDDGASRQGKDSYGQYNFDLCRFLLLPYSSAC